jgi:phosphoglycerate dehydrogenase-like enzyme
MSIILLSFEPGVLSPEQLAEIQAAAPDKRLLVSCDRKEIEAVLDEIEIAVLSFPRDLLPRAHNLRWFQQWAAGANWLLHHPEAVELDFVLTNTAGMHAIQTTEHTFALLLALGRELHHAVRAQAEHTWIPQPEHPGLFELDGRTMLLVGTGPIGQRIAAVAAAFGMRVLGVKRHPETGVPGLDRVVGPDRLLDVLPEADVVVVVVPLTAETRGLVGSRELQAMKESAVLINVGRGGTIQEDALVKALQEGWIAAAGLDVFEDEPLPQDSPLWDMDNVIITSHYAGATPYYDERAMAIFMDNLRRYQAGEPLHHVVDKQRGY